MRHVMTAGLVAILFLALGAVIAAKAEVIASCGPLAGHSYWFANKFRTESEWRDERLDVSMVFIRSGDKLDLILTGEKLVGKGTWTRSASDYGVPVVLVGGKPGEIMHILVAWGPDTALYSLDLKRKMLALAIHKTSAVDLMRAMVGKCE